MSKPQPIPTYRKLNPFIRRVIFTNGEAGHYIYLEHWRSRIFMLFNEIPDETRVRQLSVWDGFDWVNVPKRILEAKPRDIPLLRAYQNDFGIDLEGVWSDGLSPLDDNQYIYHLLRKSKCHWSTWNPRPVVRVWVRVAKGTE